MRLSNLFLTGCVACGMAFVTGSAMAAPAPDSCGSDSAMAAASDVNVQKQAASLFDNIRTEAQHARFRADRIRAENRFNQTDWVIQGDQLTLLRHNVNVMGKDLCQLQSMQSSLAPWQQADVRRIASVLPMMADNTTDAINFLNTHQIDLWLPAYHVYFRNLSSEAGQVAHTSHQAAKEARLVRQGEINPS